MWLPGQSEQRVGEGTNRCKKCLCCCRGTLQRALTRPSGRGLTTPLLQALNWLFAGTTAARRTSTPSAASASRCAVRRRAPAVRALATRSKRGSRGWLRGDRMGTRAAGRARGERPRRAHVACARSRLQDLRRFLRWAAQHLGYPCLADVEAAPPTAELEPLREGVKPQVRICACTLLASGSASSGSASSGVMDGGRHAAQVVCAPCGLTRAAGRRLHPCGLCAVARRLVGNRETRDEPARAQALPDGLQPARTHACRTTRTTWA